MAEREEFNRGGASSSSDDPKVVDFEDAVALMRAHKVEIQGIVDAQIHQFSSLLCKNSEAALVWLIEFVDFSRKPDAVFVDLSSEKIINVITEAGYQSSGPYSSTSFCISPEDTMNKIMSATIYYCQQGDLENFPVKGLSLAYHAQKKTAFAASVVDTYESE